MLMRHASPKGHRCLMFNLSGPIVSCYFYFVLFHLGSELWVLSVLYPCNLCCCSVNGSVCLVGCVLKWHSS